MTLHFYLRYSTTFGQTLFLSGNMAVLGNDDEGDQLTALLKQNNINTQYLVHSEHRITTNKIRIISRNQHMMRLDAEVTTALNLLEEEKFIAAFLKFCLFEGSEN